MTIDFSWQNHKLSQQTEATHISAASHSLLVQGLRVMDVLSQSQEPNRNPGAKRKQVRAACIACQRGKVKCDAARPSCRRCIHRNTLCEYDVEAGTSRALSLRRKNETLQGEVNQLRELISQVDHDTGAGNLHTPRRIPEATGTLGTIEKHGTGDVSLQRNVPHAEDYALSSALASLDLSALSTSKLKLRAQPWTALAGDGLVSELLSSFFAYENCYYMPFVDQERFVDDMQAGDVNHSDFCSSLLVNAICALRSSTSVRAKEFGSLQGFDVQERFLSEAKRLLVLECGKRSLSTVQALLIIYVCYVGQGKDRGGVQYRRMAYEMLARLEAQLETLFKNSGKVSEGNTNKNAKAVSRTLWGIFCFESLTAFTYAQRSEIQPPRVPRRFLDGVIDPTMTGYNDGAEKLQLSAYVLNSMCDLSNWLYDAMAESAQVNLEARLRLYQDLRQWSSGSLSLIRADIRFRPEMYGLSMYEDIIALGLLLPLDPASHLPDGLGTPWSLRLQHCARILETSETYSQTRPADRRSLSDIYPLYYAASVILVHASSSQHARDLFGRAILLLFRYVDDFPLALCLLQAFKTLAARLHLPLSSFAVGVLQRVYLSTAEMADVPVALVLPVPREILDGMSEGGLLGVHRMSVEVGDLISRFAYQETGDRSEPP